jgi:5-methylcytosine-specific restriction endonuclease McrA
MARGVAGAVHPETYEVADWDAWIVRGPEEAARLRAVAFDFPVPEVIVLHSYNDFPDLPVAFTRRNLYRRDGFRCMYCGHRPHSHQLTIDHVIPRSRGGNSVWENCVTACLKCNARKADRVPHEVGLRLLHPPSIPRWPAGLDPALLSRRPTWRRFLPTRMRRAASQ